MNPALPRGIILLAAGILLASCASVKPVLTEIPRIDSTTAILFYDPGLISSGWMSIHAGDREPAALYSPGLKNFLTGGGGSIPFRQTVSPFGRYIAAPEPKVFGKIHLSSRYVDFGIYDTALHDFSASLSAKSRFPERDDDTWSVQWSLIDSAFFYIDDDTLFKCYPSGRRSFTWYRDGLRTASASPDERTVVVIVGDTAALLDQRTGEYTPVSGSLDSKKGVRGISWTRDGASAAFGTGWRVCVIRQGKEFREFKTDGLVLWTEWLPDGSIVYTEGDIPPDMATIRTAESFKICRLNVDSGERTVLHSRLNHSPWGVRPLLSPSGKLLLFSERPVNGNLRIKLMSLDGMQMSEVCDGIAPVWGK